MDTYARQHPCDAGNLNARGGRMKVRISAALLAGSALTLLITTPWQIDIVYVTATFTETIVEQVRDSVDLEQLRDVPAKANVDEQLDYECTIALQRLTDEPLMGIMLYVDQYWNGDACQAYEHQVLHGWY